MAVDCRRKVKTTTLNTQMEEKKFDEKAFLPVSADLTYYSLPPLLKSYSGNGFARATFRSVRSPFSVKLTKAGSTLPRRVVGLQPHLVWHDPMAHRLVEGR